MLKSRMGGAGAAGGDCICIIVWHMLIKSPLHRTFWGFRSFSQKSFPLPCSLVDAITQAWVICSGRAPCTRPCPPALCPQLCGCASKILMQCVKALFYFAQALCWYKVYISRSRVLAVLPFQGFLHYSRKSVLSYSRPDPLATANTRAPPPPLPSAALRCPPSSIKNVFEMKMTEGK